MARLSETSLLSFTLVQHTYSLPRWFKSSFSTFLFTFSHFPPILFCKFFPQCFYLPLILFRLFPCIEENLDGSPPTSGQNLSGNPLSPL